jgi:DNA-binding transcriptional MocR family regulator
MEEQISQWAKKVLDHIAARAQGGIWEETRAEVAKALGCSESTVKRALHELKRAGYLEVIAPGGGRGKPTRYRVKPVKEEPVPGPESKTGPSQDSQAPGPKTPAAEPVQLEPVLAPVPQKDLLVSALVDGIED